MKRKILILILSLTMLYPGSAVAEKKPAHKGQVVLAVINGMTWSEVKALQLPVINKLIHQGTVGLMTTNSAAGSARISGNTYSTIGSGARISGGSESGYGFNSYEPIENDTVKNAYFRNTGFKADRYQVVHLGLLGMIKSNDRLKYDYCLGGLGTGLHANGYKTAVLGNSDIISETGRVSNNREVVTIAMDNNGLVDFGNVSPSTYKFSPDRLAGVTTDFEVLLGEFRKLRNRADLVVIETGDSSRVELMRFAATNKVYLAEKQRALESIDHFLENLLKEIDLKRDLVMIVVPGPSYTAVQRGNFLTPIVMVGSQIDKGLAWSGTTRREGLVTNTDIAATILHYFKLSPVITASNPGLSVATAGQPIKAVKSVNVDEKITRLNENTMFLYEARYPFVKTFINGALVIILMCVIALKFHKSLIVLQWVLLGWTFLPVIMLGASYLTKSSLILAGAEIAVAAVILTLLAYKFGQNYRISPFILSSGLTSFIILFDIWTGGTLAKTSFFSYDAMSGARFYGIGNEYMGVLIGSTILFIGLAAERIGNRTSLINTLMAGLLIFVVYVLASPMLGANVGGTIAAVAGLWTTGWIIFGGQFNRKMLLSVLLVIILVLAASILFEHTQTTDNKSHLGRTVDLIYRAGWSELFKVIIRKLEVNWKLIKNTTWSWFYFTSLVILGWVTSGIAKKSSANGLNSLRFRLFLPGIIVGSIFALVFNDSGIVAAATMIIFAIAPVLSVMLQETTLVIRRG